jgi:hypothetical protein
MPSASTYGTGFYGTGTYGDLTGPTEEEASTGVIGVVEPVSGTTGEVD